MRAYAKAIIAVLLAVAMTAYTYFNDNHLSTYEIVLILIAGVTAISVYIVPLVPEWPWVKTAIGAILAALSVFTTITVNGASINTQGWIEVAIAVATALGIGIAPAISHNGVGSNP
jgi:hypothetical protein